MYREELLRKHKQKGSPSKGSCREAQTFKKGSLVQRELSTKLTEGLFYLLFSVSMCFFKTIFTYAEKDLSF